MKEKAQVKKRQRRFTKRIPTEEKSPNEDETPSEEDDDDDRHTQKKFQALSKSPEAIYNKRVSEEENPK